VSRRFTARRPVRLSDTDATGRLRLDAVARYLQDVASDDWENAGFRESDSAWVVRRTELAVTRPFRTDLAVELETWCSGIAGSSAARRYSLRGDMGGSIEAESIWIHLDASLRPRRLDERFLEVYGASAQGRKAPTRFTLDMDIQGPGHGYPWSIRATDIDRLGHVNNAAYWAPLEEVWADRLAGPLHAVLEYRKPIDLGEQVEIVHNGQLASLVVAGELRSVARLDPEGAAEAEQLARP
jgi:acyl-ACP thioesterase